MTYKAYSTVGYEHFDMFLCTRQRKTPIRTAYCLLVCCNLIRSAKNYQNWTRFFQQLLGISVWNFTSLQV